MPTFRHFDDIEAWQRARELTKVVYQLSGRGQFAKDFGLRDQIRRATVSIMANIAEGFERDGTGEFIQFLAIAKGSAAEVSFSCVCCARPGVYSPSRSRLAK